MGKVLRRQLLVDRRVQMALALRSVAYSFIGSLLAMATAAVLLAVRGAGADGGIGLGELLLVATPALAVSLLILPLVVWDSLKVSNRFVGPLFRLRRSLRKLGEGQPVEPIIFRPGDYWHEIAEEFNAAVARIERDQRAAAQGESPRIAPPRYPVEIY